MIPSQSYGLNKSASGVTAHSSNLTKIVTKDGPHIGSVSDYKMAFQAIEMTSCERAMLRAHALAPGAEITGDDLAYVSGYFSIRIGLKKYARLAGKVSMAAGLPVFKTGLSDYLAAIHTLAWGAEEGEDWHWIMHDPVIHALHEVGIVR